MSALAAGIRDGLKTIRYWQAQFALLNENGTQIDRKALLDAARSLQPGFDEILSSLHRDGVAVIADYWPRERCGTARTEIDRMMKEHPACIRHFSANSDKRMFGVETLGDCCATFHHDAFLKSVGEIEFGFALYNLVTLGARIDATTSNRGSGDGWHRDAFGYQFKAILYLCDVTEENGPFEYVPGSQKSWRAGLDGALGRYPVPPESRIARESMDALVRQRKIAPRHFEAKAGTVILANTAGVHGGAPLKSGLRYALTNYYYFPHQIGKSLVEKFQPLPPGKVDQFESFLVAEAKTLAQPTP